MSCGWVTFAENDRGVARSLILLHSLRASKTGKQVVTLLGKDVGKDNVKKLRHYSDYIVPLEHSGSNEVEVGVAAKLQSWAIPGFDKIAFLDPHCVILKNVDNIFHKYEDGTTYLSPAEDTPVFLTKPSFEIYDDLVRSLAGKGNPEAFRHALEAHVCPQLLSEKYSIKLESGNLQVWKQPAIAIVGEEGSLNGSDMDDSLRDILGYYNQMKEGVTFTFSNGQPEKPLFTGAPEPIAITGVSCRFPCSDSLEEFWDFLLSGESGVRPRPKGRWTEAQGCVLDQDSNKREVGWLKGPVDEFDAGFFGMNPMELKFTDPQQRILLEVTYEALEDAGVNVLELYNKNVGVYMGVWKDDYKELMIESGFKGTEFFRTAMGNAYSASAARISHFLGTIGPNICSEAGCSASFVSINAACTSLRKHETNLCIATSVNLIVHPFRWEDMKAVCSPDSRCKTFDANANGFARAEGCATFILKRYSDACRQGDKIYGLIRGFGITQEGTSHSIGTPTVECESLAMMLALKEARVEPKEVSYVETHGTGTVVGDPMEINAVARAYKGERSKPLLLGSVKTNIGHTESVAGMAGLAKILLAFKHETIPPHINVKSFNPAIDFDSIPAKVVLQAESWKRSSEKKRLAGISNFGITGMDTHMIVEEPPAKVQQCRLKVKAPPQLVLTISAKSKEALHQLLGKYEALFRSKEGLSLSDVSLTLNTGRAHYEHRIAILGNSCNSVADSIKKKLYFESSASIGGKKPRVCFLYAGQGTQYANMGKELYEVYPIFRKSFDHLSAILLRDYQLDIKKAIWGFENTLVDSPVYSQVGIFVIEICVSELWKFLGLVPDVILGHSVGEFAGFVGAGVMSVEDALKLVVTRCRLVSKMPAGGMAVVPCSLQDTEILLGHFEEDSKEALDIAANNSLTQTTVAGSIKAIDKFMGYCEDRKIRVTKLNSTVAFHSRHLDPVLGELEKVAKTIEFKEPTVTLISSLTTKKVKEVTPDYWVKQTRNAVKYFEASKTALDEADVFVDVGPHSVLTALLLQNARSIHEALHHLTFLPTLRRHSPEWGTFLHTLGKLYTLGVDFNWRRFHKFFPGEKISLPFYPFQRKKHWLIPNQGNQMGLQGNREYPLIGNKLQVPVKDTKTIYVNYLNLKNIPYVNDHKLGENAIFPGAGYVEMFLEAGKSLGCPAAVRNVRFRAPLVVNAEHNWETHTVFSQEEEKAQIFCQPPGKAGWVLHAEAELVPVLKPEFTLLRGQILNEEVARLLEAPSQKTDTYRMLKELDYNFGPLFQTIVKVAQKDGDYLIEVALTKDKENHVLHPIIIDAVMQSFVVTCTEDFNHLRLPSQIGYFQVLAEPKSAFKYVYIKGQGGDQVAFLLDEELNIVSQMRGMETAASSLENIKAAIEKKKSSKTTPLFVEQFVPGTTLSSFKKRFSGLLRQDEVSTTYPPNTKDDTAIAALHKGMGLGIMLALKELGWDSFEVGEIISTPLVVKKLEICESLSLVKRILEIMEEEGILTTTRLADTYQIRKWLPLQGELVKELASCKAQSAQLVKEWELGEFYLGKLVPILKGKVNALELLFPSNGSSPTSAETFYKEAESTKAMNACVKNTLTVLLEKKTEVWEEGKTINVLEIGAGTGSATSMVLPLLEENGISFSYTFTDISSAYFVKAESKFAKYLKSMTFRTFNVEESPDLQGFSPNTYHLVVASNVLHATVDLKETLNNTRALLRKNGILLLAETFIPQRHYDLTVGHLDGYWRFTDIELRTQHCTITEPTWRKVLESTGFKMVLSTAVYKGGLGVIAAEATDRSLPKPGIQDFRKTWIVFSDKNVLSEGIIQQLKYQRRSTLLVTRGGDFSYDKMLQHEAQVNLNSRGNLKNVMEFIGPSALEGVVYMYGLADDIETTQLWNNFLYTVQEFIKLNAEKAKLVAVTKGVYYFGDQQPIPPTASAISGILRSFQTEYPNTVCKIIDVDADFKDKSNLAELIINELWENEKETIVSIRDGVVYNGRLKNLKNVFVYPPLNIPKNSEFCLDLPDSKSIADLNFRPLGPLPLGADEVEVKVRAIGFNFRDVFLVMKAFDQKTVAIGSDTAGIVTKVGEKCGKLKVGDCVFGARSGALPFPSLCVMKEQQLVKMPDCMTFEEAVTWPAAFTTDYFSLITIAKMKKGDNLLVHAATGAVGLRAVELAQDRGVNVFATAGSKRKREYLKSVGVRENQIFSSRDTSFAEKILKAGGGPCIDIVLNSLTGPGFKEASLSTCRSGACFLELSVMNIWSDEEFRKLRSDVGYHKIDVSDKNTQMSEIWADLNEEMKSFFSRDRKNIVPVNVFKAEHIRDALTFMQKAKHVGKVVCTLPEAVGLAESPIFNERSTYLITGGLGGIGLKVAEWMLQKGAKHIILCSRSEPGKEQIEFVEKLNTTFPTANVLVRLLDVSNHQDCSKTLEFIKMNEKLPPLRGIMHCAGTLSDAPFLKQNEEKLEHVMKSKVKGSWNLHLLTRDNYALEHFVMFSSFASVLGTPGQANHAAANAFMDSLAAYRHSSGLAGTSINWGQWGEVGVVATTKIHAITPMTTKDCLGSLEVLLTSQQSSAVAVDGEFSKWTTIFPWTKTYFQLLNEESFKAGEKKDGKISLTDFWKNVEEAKGNQERLSSVVRGAMIAILATLLHQPPEEINQEQDLGLDSLMNIELKNSIQALMGKRVVVPNNAFNNSRTLEKITGKVIELVQKGASSATSEKGKEISINSMGAINKESKSLASIIKEDGQLCPELRNLTSIPLPRHKPSEISTILLTGVTGNLGPYILLELARNPRIRTVHCLIRAKNQAMGLEKIKRCLEKLNLLQEVNMTKITAVVGNLATPGLGLDRATYVALAATVDGVINLAAYVNHMEEYGEKADNVPSLRSVNVLGIQELLKFTVAKKTKYFFHGSSITSLTKSEPGESTHAPEGWVGGEEFDNAPNIGYSISKFIGERILQDAVQNKGIPCKVFRFPLIGGYSKNGQQNVMRSHLFLKYVSFLKAGIMPNIDFPVPLLPVDVCANISLRLFFNDEASVDVYNVVNPHVLSELDLVQLAPGLGYSLKTVEYSEFLNHLNTTEGSLIDPLKPFYKDPNRFLAAVKQMSLLEDWKKNKEEFYLSKKVLKCVPELKELCGDPKENWERDLKYAIAATSEQQL